MATQQGPTPDDTGLVQFQIQRGAQAEATDGLVGTVEQIVVDRNTGELRALVIRSADGRSEFELPAQFVRRSTGDHVYLGLSTEQIASNPRLTQPYDPNQYIPVYEGQMEPASGASEIAHETGHPIVTDVETDSAQVVAPVSPERTPANEPPVTATRAAVNAPEQRATPTDAEARATTPGMYADFTAAPEVVAPFEALPEQGMTPVPGVTNASVNPTREQTAGGVLQTPITDTPLAPDNAGQLTVPEQQALDESQQLYHFDDIYPQGPRPESSASSPTRPNPAAPSTNPQARPLGDTGPLLGKIQPVPSKAALPSSSGNLTPTPLSSMSGTTAEQAQGTLSSIPVAAWLAAAGLAAGAGAGILIALLRRRSQPNIAQSAASTASDVAGTVTSTIGGATSAAQDALKRLVDRAQPAGADLASSVQDAASQASKSVRAASKSTSESLASVNWRPRAFRWGLLLGGLGGMLFAPRPGRILRDQLAQRINQVLSRAS